MSFRHKMGQCLGGIRTVEDLKLRCEVNEDECWIWQGGSNSTRRPESARVWLPDLGARSIQFASLYVSGNAPKRGKRAYAHCGNKLCGNPEHAKAGTQTEVMRFYAEMGRFSHAEAKIALAKVAYSRRLLTPEQAQEVRESSETGLAMAEKFGVSDSVISRIRRGETYRRQELVGASVFSLVAA